jgi:hypothetical protein
MCINASANSSDAVCSFHSLALSMYFSTSMSPIHSIFPSYCAGVVDAVVWCTGWAAMWSTVSPGVVVCGGVSRVGSVVVLVL